MLLVVKFGKVYCVFVVIWMEFSGFVLVNCVLDDIECFVIVVL